MTEVVLTVIVELYRPNHCDIVCFIIKVDKDEIFRHWWIVSSNENYYHAQQFAFVCSLMQHHDNIAFDDTAAPYDQGSARVVVVRLTPA